MSEVKMRRLLTYLTDLARFITAYPVFLFCFLGVLKVQENPAVLCTVLAVVMAFISLGVTKLVEKKVQRVLLVRIAQILMALISAAAGVFFCLALGGTALMCLFSALILCVYSILGSIAAHFPLKRFEFFFAAGVYLFTVIVLSMRGFGYPVATFIIHFVCICAIFALEFNFQNIDFLMRRRGHQMSHLPGKIRSFNLILLVVGLIVVVLLVFSRGFFMNVAGTVLRALGGVIGFLLGPLRRWWDNIPDSGGPIDIPMLDADEDPANAFELLVGEEDEPVVNVDTQFDILVVLGVGLIIFCLIYFRKYIFEWLRNIGAWFSRAIQRLFEGLRREKEFGQDENEYFTDEEERVDGLAGPMGTFAEIRAWRRDLKAYQKLPDSREKYLAGWALSVRGLELHGVEIRRSDTPREILAKGRGILDPESYAVATECCNALAFGVHEPQPAWTELQEALELLRNRKIASSKP